jgi:hypothetical protein
MLNLLIFIRSHSLIHSLTHLFLRLPSIHPSIHPSINQSIFLKGVPGARAAALGPPSAPCALRPPARVLVAAPRRAAALPADRAAPASHAGGGDGPRLAQPPGQLPRRLCARCLRRLPEAHAWLPSRRRQQQQQQQQQQQLFPVGLVLELFFFFDVAATPRLSPQLRRQSPRREEREWRGRRSRRWQQDSSSSVQWR